MCVEGIGTVQVPPIQKRASDPLGAGVVNYLIEVLGMELDLLQD